MASVSTSERLGDAGGTVLPYAPSWVDRLTDWVDRLPGPTWVFYVVVATALVVAETAVKWSDGSYPVGTFNSLHVMAATIAICCLAAMHYLDRVAARALIQFRPVLLGDEAEYQDWRYRLMTMPARPTLIVALGGVVLALVIFASGIADALMRMNLIFSSPQAILSDGILISTAWAVSAVTIYHTIRRLQIISYLYSHRTRVDLFNLGPLYALSGLTGRTAAVLSLGLTVVVGAEPDPMRFNPLMLAFIVGFAGLAAVVFVAPLLGIHRLLAEEKDRLLAEAGQRVKAMVGALHQRVDTGETQDAAGLNAIMSGLATEQTMLGQIPTWPWHADTLRLVITAILFPLALWVVQRALDTLFR